MRQSEAPRILYIDGGDAGRSADRNSGNFSSMLRHLENCPYRMSTAATPDEALELIASEPFDLFIHEHQLREMSGVELCRRIRQTDKKTPILFFSGRTRLMDGEVSIAAGATEYLVRPIGEDHLIDTIRRLLKDRIYSSGDESKNQSSCCLAK